MQVDAFSMYHSLMFRLNYCKDDKQGQRIADMEDQNYRPLSCSLISQVTDRIRLAVATPILSLNLLTQSLRGVDCIAVGLIHLQGSRIKEGCLDLVAVVIQAIVLPVLLILAVINPVWAGKYARGLCNLCEKKQNKEETPSQANESAKQPDKSAKQVNEEVNRGLCASCLCGCGSMLVETIQSLAHYIIERPLAATSFVIDSCERVSLGVIAPRSAAFSTALYEEIIQPILLLLVTPAIFIYYPQRVKEETRGDESLSHDSHCVFNPEKGEFESKNEDSNGKVSLSCVPFFGSKQIDEFFDFQKFES